MNTLVHSKYFWIGIILFILLILYFNKNNKSNYTQKTNTYTGSGGEHNVAGCAYNLSNGNLESEDSAQKICNSNPNCKGYYLAGYVDKTFIMSDLEPSAGNSTKYINDNPANFFKSKSDNYKNSKSDTFIVSTKLPDECSGDAENDMYSDYDSDDGDYQNDYLYFMEKNT